MKNSIKYFILLLLLNLNTNFIEAKKVSGFILTENSDTIFGQIKLSKFNLQTGAYFIFGIYKEQLHFEVCFKDSKSKKFRNFQAIDISGFGFNYKSKDYIFHSFTLESNTKIINEKKHERFLQLIHNGKIKLYRNLTLTSKNDKHVDYSHNENKEQSYTYYDFFLYNKYKGLTKVEISKNVKTINQLLNKYDLDEEYVKIIPSNTKLKDIKVILIDYDLWLKYNRKIKLARIKTLASAS